MMALRRTTTRTARIGGLAVFLALASGRRSLEGNEVHNVLPYSWSFQNFSTDHCAEPPGYYTWDRYRETYIGIPPEPSINNGFDWLFFNFVFEKELGSAGNCFGLSLMSLQIKTKGGHLGFCGPVGQYSGDNTGMPALMNDECVDEEGEPITGTQLTGPTNVELRRAIEETHGHQVNLAAVRYTIDQISQKRVTGDHAYADVEAHAPALVNIIKDTTSPFGAGHTVLAYAAREVNGERRIYVYDPNRSLGATNPIDPNHPDVELRDQREWYEKGNNYITINNDGSWSFRFAGWIVQRDENGDPLEDEDGFTIVDPDDWPTGGDGLIVVLPLSVVAPRDRNPASMGLSVTSLLSKIFLSGSGATLKQVMAPGNKFAFVPGTKKLELAPAKCLLEIFPLFPSDGPEAWGRGKELYTVIEPADGPRDYEIQPGSDGYFITMSSGAGTLSVQARGGGRADVLRVEDQVTDDPKLMLFNTAGVESYDVEFFRILRPDESLRSIKLTELVMVEDDLVDLRLSADGEGMVVTSPLSAVTFDLEFSSTEGGAVSRARVQGLALEPGGTSLIRPQDWSKLDEDSILGGARRLTSEEIEDYQEVVYGGLPSGSVGPDFDDSRDLGGARGGETTYDGASGHYTQVSSGDGIGPGGDSFHFVYKRLRGEFEFTVEIADSADPRGTTGAPGVRGLMARQDASPAARFSQIQTLTAPGADDWPRWAYRYEHGVAGSTLDSHSVDFEPDQQPRFLKLVRRGATFYGFLSRDGKSWRPVGSDTWYGLEPGAEVLVGFASTTGADPTPAVTTFKVHRLGGLGPSLLEPVPDDGVSRGERIYEAAFEGEDGSEPEGFSVQRSSGGFTPQLRSGRLQLTREGSAGSATAAFSRLVLDDVEAGIYQFDFDFYLEMERPGEPGEGLTFALLGGDDPGLVGLPDAALGYEGIGAGSLAWEFDIWNNSTRDEGPGFTDAPPAYHVGIDSHNQVASVVRSSDELPDPFDPEGVHATVLYNRGDVSVFLASNRNGRDDARLTLRTTLLPISFCAADGRAVFGFTASTSERTLKAEVDNLVVTRIHCDDVQEVAEILGTPENPVPRDTIVTLDGSASHGGKGDEAREPVSHFWEIVSGGAEIVGPADGPTVNLRTAERGPVVVRLNVDDGVCENPTFGEVEFTVEGAPRGNWIRCDCNGDGDRNITDPIAHLRWQFLGDFAPPCRAACDCDANGAFEITDALFDLSFQFLGGPPPPLPYPDCDSFPSCDDACPFSPGI